MTHINRIFGIAALGLAMLTAGPAIAQTQGGQAGQMPPAAQSAQSFSQNQLRSFSDALTRIVDIRKTAQQKMQQAGSKEAQTQIVKQARGRMLAAIKDSGLTLKEYNQIASAARANPDLAQKIKQMQ